MNFREKAENSAKDAHYKQVATKILDGIKSLISNADDSSERRWVWELMQNAKDVAPVNVKIEIELNHDFVEFRHNGAPFTIDNLTYLIEQVSTKDRSEQSSEKTSGKFGTGFMATHLLSRVVNIDSVIQYSENGEQKKYKNFTLMLDRSGNQIDEIISSVHTAFDVFDRLDNENNHIENYASNQKCDTKFKYPLDSQSQKTALIAIEDLFNTLPFTLVFIEKIETIQIIDNINRKTYRYYKTNNVIHFDDVVIHEIVRENEVEKEIFHIASYSNNNVSIAIGIDKQNESFKIKEKSKSTPVLYCEFPLIGSEEFNLPVVVNSAYFNPTESRSAISLADKVLPEIEQNKQLVKNIIPNFLYLLSVFIKNNFQDLCYLAKVKLPKDRQFISDEWYKENIKSVLRKELLNLNIVDSFDGKIALKESRIPYNVKEESNIDFFHLTKVLKSNIPSSEEHIKVWRKIIDDEWGVKLKYEIEDFVSDIAENRSLITLSNKISKSYPETLQWLDKVVSLIISEEETDLLNDYAILPNQLGEFCKKDDLFKDDNIPNELKDILELLGKERRSKLLHKEISSKIIARDDLVLNIQKITNEINMLFEDDKIENREIAAFQLISFIPCDIDTETKKHRDTVCRLMKDFFSDEIPENKLVYVWHRETWKNCDKFILFFLSESIKQLGVINKLSEKLNKDFDSTIIWIDEYIDFISTYSKSILKNSCIIPNMYDEFCLIEDVYNNIDISIELIDIYILLSNEIDWKLILKRDGIAIEAKDNKTKEEICKKIDNLIYERGHLDEPKIRKAISETRKFIKSLPEEEALKLFSNIYPKIDKYFLSTIDEDIENLIAINESGKSEVLARIAKNQEITPEILEQVSENIEEIKQYIEYQDEFRYWLNSIAYQNDYNALTEEEREFNFETGYLGELFVFNELKSKINQLVDNVKIEWLNLSDDSNYQRCINWHGSKIYINDAGRQYDIKVTIDNVKEIYIEVKSTTTDISRSDDIKFPISKREWDFIRLKKSTDKYYLARVFSTRDNPYMHLLRFEEKIEI
ncbi:MAG: DUF3883 domain-containing protein [Bacteroidales bacterium]|nr:DUF3883 domain-containing protein [Bacteroidales bacterium]